jgi:hypothetical protein
MKYLGQPQSGSQANTTASHNRAGQYLRNRRTPVTPTRTSKQGVLRGKFGSASAAWQSLTTALQNAWTAFAANYPVKDSLGQTVVLTGQQYFIGIQTSLMNAGQAMNTAVPSNTSTPAIDTPVLYVADDGTVIVSVASVAAGDFNLVALSKILSNGKNFNQQFSQFAVLTATGLVVDLTTAYAAQYGAPTAGKKLFARFKEVNSSGMSGPNLIIQSSVVAAGSLSVGSISAGSGGTVSWTGGTTTLTTATLFDSATGAAIQSQPLVAGSCVFSTPSSGKTVYARGTDGSAWTGKSNVLVIS